jgi:hypothetical protein
MRRSEEVWRGSEVPFFGSYVARRDPGMFLAFADRGSRSARRIAAILLAAGSVIAGVATTGFFFFAALILEFGTPPDGTDVGIAIALGAAVAVGGVAIAVAEYRRAGRPVGLTVHDDRLTIVYPSFARPLVVPRSAVRAIAIEAGSQSMRDRERFAVAGDVPDDAFVDALDVPSAGPLGDLDTARRWRIDPTPGVIWERPDTPAHGHGYAHDDPDRAGWASGGSTVPPARSRTAFLFNKHGHSLPFLRSDVLDVPNVAVVFEDPIRIPRPSFWFEIAPRSPRSVYYRGGRRARGVLLHVADPVTAERTLGRWGVVRQITAEDVTDEGLLLAKPLVGWRATAYAALVVGPIVLNLIIRWLR